jgi:hypothetical protein
MTVEYIILKSANGYVLPSHFRFESLTDDVLSQETILDFIVLDWDQGKLDKKFYFGLVQYIINHYKIE